MLSPHNNSVKRDLLPHTRRRRLLHLCLLILWDRCRNGQAAAPVGDVFVRGSPRRVLVLLLVLRRVVGVDRAILPGERFRCLRAQLLLDSATHAQMHASSAASRIWDRRGLAQKDRR